MSRQTLALVDQNVLLILVLLLGVFVGIAVERVVSDMRRRAWRERNRWRWEGKPKPSGANRWRWKRKPKPSGANRWHWKRKPSEADTPSSKGSWLTPERPVPKPPDAADQLRIVMTATFTVQPLLNKGEVRVFKELAATVIRCNPGWQVMAQVSLGEVLRCGDPEAYSCINSKRVDLLLVDEACKPRHAIEYQGAAHHQGTAAARDAVKKEALRRAGIGYHEVVAGHTTPSELRQLVEKLVDKSTALK
jgi:Protein of unknown function (DUF2726)